MQQRPAAEAWAQAQLKLGCDCCRGSDGRPLLLRTENSRNFGQGIDVTKTAAEALTIAARNEEQQAEGEEPREHVLQPHIVRPLLFGGAKFHIRVCALLPSPPLWPRCAKEDPCSSLCAKVQPCAKERRGLSAWRAGVQTG